jgi:hypothetical protein
VKVTGNAVKSMATLIEQKTNPDSLTFQGNEFTESGHANEPIAAALYALQTARRLHTGLRPVEHSLYPWLGASLDGVTDCGRNVEIKCLHGAKIYKAPKSVHKQQAQVQMACAGLPVTDLVYYYVDIVDSNTGKRKMDIHEVQYDDEWFQLKLPKFLAFATELLKAHGCCYQLDDAWDAQEVMEQMEAGHGVQDQTAEEEMMVVEDYEYMSDGIDAEDMWMLCSDTSLPLSEPETDWMPFNSAMQHDGPDEHVPPLSQQ